MGIEREEYRSFNKVIGYNALRVVAHRFDKGNGQPPWYYTCIYPARKSREGAWIDQRDETTKDGKPMFKLSPEQTLMATRLLQQADNWIDEQKTLDRQNREQPKGAWKEITATALGEKKEVDADAW